MARNTDLSIYRGEDVTISGTVYATDATDAAAQDITGWTLSFYVARDANDKTKLITKSGSIVSAAAGTFTVSLAEADTSSISPGVYSWNIWRTNSGSKRLIGYGTFTILGGTRLPS